MFPQIQVFLNLLLFCLHINALVNHADTRAKILILGAGASGLQAARTLHDNGMDDFIIVEAADRTGGRVQSTQFAGYTVGLGALWAAPENSKTHQIVRDLDLGRHTSDYESLTIRNATGHDVTDEADANYERLEKGIEKLHELSARLKQNDDLPDISMRSALRIGEWIPQSAIDKAIEWFEYDFEYAEAPEVSSTKAAFERLSEETIDYITDEGGFERIFDEVAGFLKTPEYINHTRLSQKVVSIDYRNDVSVVVTCEDGTRYIGEYVLITFSIGVLQNNLVQFIPPLPEWKDVEIKKFQMAAYTIIYVSFPSKFWDDAEWILYASEKRGYFPLFLNYQAEGLFPSGTPMMMVTVAGDESRRVEAQPSNTTKAEIQQVLRDMYGDSIPEATNILVTDWSQNPLTKGSYSNVPVEVPTKCRQKLQSRVGRLFFGGEATSEDLNGYIAGGLDSGDREARKMLQCLEDFAECPAFEGFGLECEKANMACSIRSSSASLLGLCSLFLILYYILN
ncbi:polyamine oxidase 7-like [Patiria miniata]|uniref:Amine oxidase domain-containing protein n=1 Tax=Patiria miniata TaxID=46514 RepID=A0A914B3B4_PATMI|nr:polyamine oxidase 7-like [Patiria miniata]